MKFLFLSGRIRALQSKLLSQAQIERMVADGSAEDAFRVFSELQYADYLFPDTKLGDFEKIIDQGLLETKELIVNGTNNAVEFDVLWKPFDANNVKRALKEKIVDEADGVSDFSPNNGYETLGSISREVLESAVFGNKFASSFPKEFAEVIQSAKELYETEEGNDFQLVEFAVDNALFAYLQRLGKENKSNFIKKVVSWQIDRANLKTMLRSKSLQQEISESMYIEGGALSLDLFLSDVSVENFVAFLFENDFLHLATKLQTETLDSFEALLLKLERLIEAETTQFLLEADEEDLGTVVVPMVYFVKRVKNARILKFVMYAKIYGLDPEKIYETIKHF